MSDISIEGTLYSTSMDSGLDRLVRSNHPSLPKMVEDRIKALMNAGGRAFRYTLPRDDFKRLTRHRRVAEEYYKELDANTRAMIEAFQAGVKRFITEHPDQVPAWAPTIEPWQVVALGRYIIWGWPEGEAGGDLSGLVVSDAG